MREGHFYVRDAHLPEPAHDAPLPGTDHWEEISWDDAIMRVAHKIRKTRCDLDCHVWPLMVLVIGLIVTRPGPATNEVTKF